MTVQVVDTRHGRQLCFDTDRYHYPLLTKYGDYNHAEVDLFQRLVQPGSVVIDVGAHVGCHTVALSRVVGDAGLVMAFEPQRPPFYALCGTLALNGAWNVVAHNAALGDKVGRIAVPCLNYDHPNNFGGIEIGALGSDVFPTYEVPIVPLDSFGMDRVAFIKIDVEGMEERVLAGARETIARCRPLLYVEDDRPHNSARLRRAIADLGYSLHLHMAPLTQPRDNYRGEAEDIFPGIVAYMLLGVPEEISFESNLARIDLEAAPANAAA